MYEKQKTEIEKYIKKNFSDKRRVHTYGVRDVAVHLGELYGEDIEKCEIAALFHDMFRGVKVDSVNYYVKHLGLPTKYIDNVNLAHSKIAAIIMKRDYDINDENIINAVSYHTTGRENMSKLEKIIYLSDAIEPMRAYPKVDEIRKLSEIDLDKACLMSMTNTIDFVSEQGKYLDEDTKNAAEFLRKEIQTSNGN